MFSPVRRRVPWQIAVMLVLAVGVGGVIIAPYLALDPAGSRVVLREGVAAHWPLLVTHIFTGGVAVVIGPLQFLPALRRRRRLHRTLGRVYLGAGVLPSGITGLAVAVLSTSGLTTQVGLFLPALLWLITGWYGYRAARDGRFADHREWMIRSYAIAFLAVTARMWVPLLMLVQLPVLQSEYGGNVEALVEASIPVGQWVSWVVNLIVAEVVIHRTRGSGEAAAGTTAHSRHDSAAGAVTKDLDSTTV